MNEEVNFGAGQPSVHAYVNDPLNVKILSMMLDGETDRAISEKLEMSFGQVRHRTRRIRDLHGCSTKKQLIEIYGQVHG